MPIALLIHQRHQLQFKISNGNFQTRFPIGWNQRGQRFAIHTHMFIFAEVGQQDLPGGRR
jgi:hypothetical protein